MKFFKDKNEIPNILLLFGNEDFLIDECYENVISLLVTDESDTFNFDVRSSGDLDIDGLISIANSYPMMGDKRVLVVRDFNKLFDKTDKKSKGTYVKFEKYLNNPQKSTYLILLGAPTSINGISSHSKTSEKYKKIAKSLKFPFDFLINNGFYKEFGELNVSNMLSWTKNKFEDNNLQINSEALNYLIVQNNNSLRSLDNEINKICIYFLNNKDKVISIEDINYLSGSSSDFTIFDLQKAIGNKNLSKSIEILNKLQQNSKQGVFIVSVLSRYFITLFKLSDVDNPSDKFSIAPKIGISPYFFDDYFSAMKKIGEEKIELALKMLAEIDYKLKSTTDDETFMIQNLFIKVLK